MTKFADWLLRHFRQFLAVAYHDELLDAALEIGFGIPSDFYSISFARRFQVERRGRRRGVARSAGLHVFHPRLRDGFVRQPNRFVAIAFELRRWHCFIAE